MCLFFFQAEDGIRDPEMSRGLGDVYKRQVFEPVDSADFAGKSPSRYGSRAVLFISVSVGVIIKNVKKRAIAIKTWFGGVCWVPIACLRIERTIIILVKEVAPRTIEGSKVSPVINASIWRDNE